MSATNRPTGSLYVGDLDDSVVEATLHEVFKQVGPVASIRVCRDSITRRSLGYAYVNFHNIQDAEKALNVLNYQQPHGGKPWRIMWSHRDPSIRKSGVGNIFIKNLHKDIDHQSLYDTFSHFGNILSCKVVYDERGVSKGYGFVHFETVDAANQAIQQTNRLIMNNKEVYVGQFVPRTERGPQKNPEDFFTNVYVKNVDESVSEEEYNELLGKYGPTSSIALMKSPDGKHRGFGFVNYLNHEDAVKAVNGLNNFNLKNKVLYASRAMKRHERDAFLKRKREEMKKKYDGVNLYVKNLEDSVTEAKLREAFAKYGEITSCKIMISDNGVSKGFGFVCYSKSEEATRALEMNGQMLGSKPLYVAHAQRKEERRQHLQVQHATNRAMRQVPGPYFPFPPVPYPMQPRFPHPGQQPRAGYPMSNFPGSAVPKKNTNRRFGPNAGQRGPSSGGKPRKPAPSGNRNSDQIEIPDFSTLSNFPPEQRRQILGETLYSLIHNFKSDDNLTARLTGIILEAFKDGDDSELIALIEDQNELMKRMEEAFNTLEKGQQN